MVRARRNGESRNASDQARKQRQDIDRAIEEAVVGLGISKENWSKLVAIKNSRNEEMHRSEIVEIVNELKLFIVDNPNLEESPALQEAIDKIQPFV